MRLRDLQQPFRLAAFAKKATDIRITKSEQPFDDMNSEETACAGNQNLQACTSG
jgi:hypothetical protein